MKLILDSKVPNGVHVLVIGVGGYDSNIGSLRGAAVSARRIAEFWLDSPTAMTAGRTLASIDMLASDSKTHRVKCRHSDGQEHVVREPTFEAVGAAIRDWVDRAQGAGLAVLHWIGHGELESAMTDPSYVQALFCRDATFPRDRAPEGAYAWEATRREIEVRLDAPKLFFIDACQVDRARPHQTNAIPWPDQSPKRTRVNGARFRPGIEGNSTFCAPLNKQIEPGLMGGALFTEAIRSALARHGAKRSGADRRYAAHVGPIKEAADAKIARWCSQHPSLSKQPVAVSLETGSWRGWDPIVTIDGPHGLVDIGAKPPAFLCEQRCDVGAVEQHRGANHWEADLPFGDHKATLYSKTPFGSFKAEATKRFGVGEPYRTVNVDGGDDDES